MLSLNALRLHVLDYWGLFQAEQCCVQDVMGRSYMGGTKFLDGHLTVNRRDERNLN